MVTLETCRSLLPLCEERLQNTTAGKERGKRSLLWLPVDYWQVSGGFFIKINHIFLAQGTFWKGGNIICLDCGGGSNRAVWHQRGGRMREKGWMPLTSSSHSRDQAQRQRIVVFFFFFLWYCSPFVKGPNPDFPQIRRWPTVLPGQCQHAT